MGQFKIQLVGMVLFCFLNSCMRSCSSTPEPIKLGEDSCEHCHMNISDPRFAAEFVTQKGRVYKFDSLTCLVKSYKELKEEPRFVFVSDFIEPSTLIDVNSAHFFVSSEINGPMGPTPIAFANLNELEKIAGKFKGEITDWNSIISPQKK